MAADVVLRAIGGAIPFQGGHQVDFLQSVLAPVVGVVELAIAHVSDDGGDGVIEKRSVFDQFGVADGVLESARAAADGEANGTVFTRLERRGEAVDAIVQALVVFRQNCAGYLDLGRVIAMHGEMYFVERLRIGIVNHSLAAHGEIPRFRINIDGVLHAARAGWSNLSSGL